MNIDPRWWLTLIWCPLCGAFGGVVVRQLLEDGHTGLASLAGVWFVLAGVAVVPGSSEYVADKVRGRLG